MKGEACLVRPRPISTRLASTLPAEADLLVKSTQHLTPEVHPVKAPQTHPDLVSAHGLDCLVSQNLERPFLRGLSTRIAGEGQERSVWKIWEAVETADFRLAGRLSPL